MTSQLARRKIFCHRQHTFSGFKIYICFTLAHIGSDDFFQYSKMCGHIVIFSRFDQFRLYLGNLALDSFGEENHVQRLFRIRAVGHRSGPDIITVYGIVQINYGSPVQHEILHKKILIFIDSFARAES